jgi:hypothetical protein
MKTIINKQSEMKKQSKIKRQNIITALLVGLVLSLPVVISQEVTQMLRRINDPANGSVLMMQSNALMQNNALMQSNAWMQNSLMLTTPVIDANRPIVPEPLIVQSNSVDHGLTLSEKDLMFAGGGFGGDGQKMIPVRGGMFFLIVCTIGYALVKRRKWRTR